jgi:hypothetical protein
MMRIIACWMAILLAPALAEDAPPPTSNSPPPCEPQPDCRLIVSPLRPGAPGVGIRDKALLEQSLGPLRQPRTDSVRIPLDPFQR